MFKVLFFQHSYTLKMLNNKTGVNVSFLAWLLCYNYVKYNHWRKLGKSLTRPLLFLQLPMNLESYQNKMFKPKYQEEFLFGNRTNTSLYLSLNYKTWTEFINNYLKTLKSKYYRWIWEEHQNSKYH